MSDAMGRPTLDERQALRRRVGAAAGASGVVVTVGLNVPRDCPNSLWFAEAFAAAWRELLWRRVVGEADVVETLDDWYGAAAVRAGSALWVKRVLVAIETRHPLGRLFDLDVWAGEHLVDGAAVGRPYRPCFLCERPALVCRREGTHARNDVIRWALETAERWGRSWRGITALTRRVARWASAAVAAEATATPKPGLVDERGSGVHDDMDLELLVASGRAIAPFFRACVGRAARRAMRGLTERPAALRRLRSLGRRAEAAMFAATGGVNTHKGLVFSLGLLCGAVGLLVGEGTRPRAAEVCAAAARMTEGLVERELMVLGEAGTTKGERNWLHHRSAGVRGEATAGFPSVLNHGLPEYERSAGRHGAAVRALLALMAVVDDGVVLARGGPAGLAELQRLARAALAGRWPDEAAGVAAFDELEEFCRRRRLSPGGSADLLAATLFLARLEFSWYCGDAPSIRRGQKEP